MCLGTAAALRQGFRGPIYADLHSLFLGMQHDGMRVRRPLPDAPSWFGCFDMVQLNEDEMRELSPDPLALSADAISAGVGLLVVTLGARGAAYVEAPGFDGRSGPHARGAGASTGTVRSALVEAEFVEAVDPTGCGDVFGATAFSRLLAGDDVETALRHANRMAGRNAAFRGATGLADHLRGELVRP
jgi:sugar/nucleoside kinase (ribokinase family)